MTPKQKRAALTAELSGLVASVKAGDEAAMSRASDITAEIDEIDEHLEKAAEKAATFSAIAATAAKTHIRHEEKKMRNLGEAAVEAVKNSGLERGAKAGKAVAEFKAADDTIVEPSTGDHSISDRIGEARAPLAGVRGLFSAETVSAPTVGYYALSFTGTAGATAEDGAKPQASAEAELVTTNLKKVAVIMKQTDEILSDYPRLVSAINDRGVYMKDAVVDAQLLTGDGQDGELTGLLNVTGITEDTYANGADVQAQAEAIYGAAADIKADTGYDADAVIMNPADFKAIRLAKDENGQYFGGGFFQGEYGNGGNAMTPDLWGLKVVTSSSVTEGTYIVGAFRIGGAVASKGGTRVEVGYDGEDFSHDRVTLRVEERLALEVFVPAAFVVLTEAAA